jgi:hypothetical protein
MTEPLPENSDAPDESEDSSPVFSYAEAQEIERIDILSTSAVLAGQFCEIFGILGAMVFLAGLIVRGLTDAKWPEPLTILEFYFLITVYCFAVICVACWIRLRITRRSLKLRAGTAWLAAFYVALPLLVVWLVPASVIDKYYYLLVGNYLLLPVLSPFLMLRRRRYSAESA